MDTKSKKNRPLLSFFSLLLGFHCLVACVVAACYVLPREGGWEEYYDFVQAENYQETTEFRRAMSSVLYDAIAMTISSQNQDAGLQQNLSLPDSPNLLYFIRYESKEVMRSQAGAISVSEKVPSFPEEYNFILHFDGKKVTILKDGQMEDVYGSGYYTQASKWELPGFQGGERTMFSDFPSDQLVRCNVWLAARKELLPVSSYDILLEIQGKQSAFLRAFFFWWIILVTGIVLLLLYLLMRSSRSAFWRKAADVTAHFWFEWKIIAFVVLLLCTSLLLSVGQFLWLDFSFWYLIFLINDLHQNKGGWKHNGPAILWRLLERRRALLSFQKKLLGYGPAVWGGIAIYLVLSLSCLLAFHEEAWIPILPLTLVALYFWHRGRKTFCVAIEETGRILDRIAAVSRGETLPPLMLTFDSDLAQSAQNLNSIESGIREAVERQMSSERMKIELISNVSHDLKTPLTSIISYVQLLKEEELSETAKSYVQILEQKAERLKTMVQDVFEVSKAATGNLSMQKEPLDLTKLIRQTMADMNEQIENSTLSFRVSLSEEIVLIYADGQKLYRVFQNLFENILRYSLEGTRVYVRQETGDDTTKITLRNVSRDELPASIDLTERFVRGDDSRTDGGSGLGLSIAKSFTEACGGTFRVETDGDLFTVVVCFPVFRAPNSEEAALPQEESPESDQNVSQESSGKE